MRLWNALHTLVREKLAGRGRAGKKGVRPRSRLEVEGLDQRLLPSYQMGVHQVILAPVQPVNPGQAPSYDLATHEKGAPVAGPVSSYSFGATNPVATQPLTFLKYTFSDDIVSQTPLATPPVSLNFVPPLPSFSWGAGSPD
jgi:hypothetical protein